MILHQMLWKYKWFSLDLALNSIFTGLVSSCQTVHYEIRKITTITFVFIVNYNEQEQDHPHENKR